MTSRLAMASTAITSWAPQLHSHRRPWCHRGDSPITKSFTRMFATDIEAPFRPPAHAGVSPPTRIASARIDIERRKRTTKRDPEGSGRSVHTSEGLPAALDEGSFSDVVGSGERVVVGGDGLGR